MRGTMSPPRKSLMRCLGEFVGHVVRGAKSNPSGSRSTSHRQEIRRDERVERRGNLILRRTVVEEIETRDDERPPT